MAGRNRPLDTASIYFYQGYSFNSLIKLDVNRQKAIKSQSMYAMYDE